MPCHLTAQGMICTLSFMSHIQIIAKWPSLSDFASDLGVAYGTAKAMKRRGSIPADRWVDVVEKAKARKIKDITLEKLAMAKAERV
jgi:hypothetical protein